MKLLPEKAVSQGTQLFWCAQTDSTNFYIRLEDIKEGDENKAKVKSFT